MKKFILADKQLSNQALASGGIQKATETGEPIPLTGFDKIHLTNVTLSLNGNHYEVYKTIYRNGLIERHNDFYLELKDARLDFKKFTSKHKLKIIDQTAHYQALAN